MALADHRRADDDSLAYRSLGRSAAGLHGGRDVHDRKTAREQLGHRQAGRRQCGPVGLANGGWCAGAWGVLGHSCTILPKRAGCRSSLEAGAHRPTPQPGSDEVGRGVGSGRARSRRLGRGRLAFRWVARGMPSWTVMVHLPRRRSWWWREHSRARFGSDALKPSLQWATWWASHQAGGRSQPGRMPPPSRTSRARRSHARQHPHCAERALPAGHLRDHQAERSHRQRRTRPQHRTLGLHAGLGRVH
ncbi:MAG: hypothetical protein RLZ55_351 [Actinomycetota bacterium]